MPYDASKSRDLLRIVGVFTSQPGGEYIQELATQLKDSEGEITAANQRALKAEGDANRYATELATIQATIRTLREENEALKAAAPKVTRVFVGSKKGKVAQVIALPESKKAL